MSDNDSLKDEVFLPVVGYEDDYVVSNYGRIKRVRNSSNSKAGHTLKPLTQRNGYLKVNLYDGGTMHRVPVHRLVAAAFIGPRPEGLQVNHIDGDKKNNHISNLEYVTPSENIRHGLEVLGIQRAHGEAVYHAKLTESEVLGIRALHDLGNATHKELGEIYGVSASNIGCIVRRHTWKHIP